MPDDEELMVRVREGEQSALEGLFARWEPRLFAFFYRVGCPPSSVADLTEEVLVSVFRQRQRYDPARPFAPWLYGVARLVWRDHLRHHRREVSHTVPFDAVSRAPATGPAPAEIAEAREEADTVRRAIERLPDALKVAFVLRHYHGLSYQELAEAVQAPLGTVKWRIHEAMRRLETALARPRTGRSPGE